jgi:large subunit ribosomal protein L32e
MKKKFIRQDSRKKVKLGKKWRRPRGLHSKLRLQKKGHPKLVSVGYGGKGNKKELSPVLVYSLKDLEMINPKEQCILISKTVGLRKKIEILKQSIKKQIKVSNIKDAQSFINEKEELMKKRKQEKEKANKEREEKRKQEKKETKKKESTDKKVEKTDKDKKEEEKKEKDKLLTKRTE